MAPFLPGLLNFHVPTATPGNRVEVPIARAMMTRELWVQRTRLWNASRSAKESGAGGSGGPYETQRTAIRHHRRFPDERASAAANRPLVTVA